MIVRIFQINNILGSVLNSGQRAFRVYDPDTIFLFLFLLSLSHCDYVIITKKIHKHSSVMFCVVVISSVKQGLLSALSSPQNMWGNKGWLSWAVPLWGPPDRWRIACGQKLLCPLHGWLLPAGGKFRFTLLNKWKWRLQMPPRPPALASVTSVSTGFSLLHTSHTSLLLFLGYPRFFFN